MPKVTLSWAVLAVVAVLLAMTAVALENNEFPDPFLKKTDTHVVRLQCKVPPDLATGSKVQRIEIQNPKGNRLANITTDPGSPFRSETTLHADALVQGTAVVNSWYEWNLTIITPFTSADSGRYKCLIVYTDALGRNMAERVLALTLDRAFVDDLREKTNNTLKARSMATHHVTVTWRPPVDRLFYHASLYGMAGDGCSKAASPKVPLFSLDRKQNSFIYSGTGVVLANLLNREGAKDNYTLSVYVQVSRATCQPKCAYRCEVFYASCVGDKASRCFCNGIGCLDGIGNESVSSCTESVAAAIALGVICFLLLLGIFIYCCCVLRKRRNGNTARNQERVPLVQPPTDTIREKLRNMENEVNNLKRKVQEEEQSMVANDKFGVIDGNLNKIDEQRGRLDDLCAKRDRLVRNAMGVNLAANDLKVIGTERISELSQKAKSVEGRVDAFLHCTRRHIGAVTNMNMREEITVLKKRFTHLKDDMQKWVQDANNTFPEPVENDNPEAVNRGAENPQAEELINRLITKATDFSTLTQRASALLERQESLNRDIERLRIRTEIQDQELDEHAQEVNLEDLENKQEELSKELDLVKKELAREKKEQLLKEKVESTMPQLERMLCEASRMGKEVGRMRLENKRNVKELDRMNQFTGMIEQEDNFTKIKLEMLGRRLAETVKKTKTMLEKVDEARSKVGSLQEEVVDGHEKATRERKSKIKADLVKVKEKAEQLGSELKQYMNSLETEELKRMKTEMKRKMDEQRTCSENLGRSAENLTQKLEDLRTRVINVTRDCRLKEPGMLHYKANQLKLDASKLDREVDKLGQTILELDEPAVRNGDEVAKLWQRMETASTAVTEAGKKIHALNNEFEEVATAVNELEGDLYKMQRDVGESHGQRAGENYSDTTKKTVLPSDSRSTSPVQDSLGAVGVETSLQSNQFDIDMG